MDKLLDILTRLEQVVDIEDGAWREWMLSLIHQAMDIAVKGKAHKWPEEKPDRNGRYLALIEREYNNFITILEWHGGEWFRYTYEKEVFVREDAVTHWWHLPEVTE